jgi:phosphatidylserine/phosphatidylglycerophosphate/cardiolipin synthase-like enzyme
MTRLTATARALVAATLLLTARGALAEHAETLASPSFRRGNLLQFKVGPGVHSISVMATTHATNGRTDVQIFELTPESAKGELPGEPGYQMWETSRIFAARDQWEKARHLIDRIEFSYIVRKLDGAGQRTAVESEHVYEYANQGEALSNHFASGQFRVVGRNPGRKLDRLTAAEVQAAVDRLARNAPKAEYLTLPGDHPHPLHPKQRLLDEIARITAAKVAAPHKDLFIKVAVYNQDDPELTRALVEAKRVGVDVEKITDWYQTTPYLQHKPSVEALREAGIPVIGLVRNDRYGDLASMHAKMWIFAERAGGRIVNGTVADCTFNTEFGNWPKNQEDMFLFRNNRDVATVYNHFFEAMKGNAPLRLEVDPARSKFILTHPLYPYVTGDGAKFGSFELERHVISLARHHITTMDLVMQDADLAEDLGQKVRAGVRVDAFVNGWKAKNGAGAEAGRMAALGVDTHLVFFRNEDSSPVHHKTGEVDGEVAFGGSLNPGKWGLRADETKFMLADPEVARAVRAQANRLAHDYRTENWGRPYEVRHVDVDFHADAPAGVEPHAVRQMTLYDAAGEPVELRQDAGARRFRGRAPMPEGVVRGGWLAVQLHDGGRLEGPVLPFQVRAQGGAHRINAALVRGPR